MSRIALADARDLALRVLVAAGTSEANARPVAQALVAADADGIDSHGLSRLPTYADQVTAGKTDGKADPVFHENAAAALMVDAATGFAYRPIAEGLARGQAIARRAGIAAVGITNSSHCGAVGTLIEGVARDGLVCLGFSNSPGGIAPWGAARAIFGTNPIAFACPRRAGPPLVVDLALAKVARGKIRMAADRGEAIPADWALDKDGRPTTDAKAALDGTVLPMGDAKGSALVLVVELLAAALTGARFGFEASSFFTAKGEPSRVGQLFLIIDPARFAGDLFLERVETLLAAILAEKNTRLPGDRRLAARARAARDGIEIPAKLLDELRRRAGP